MRASSESKLVNMLAHSLGWIVFGIGIFFYHPLFSGVDIPLQAWITQGVTLVLLVISFYVNGMILVPRLLLRRHPAFFLVTIAAIIFTIVVITGSVDRAFDPYHRFHLSANFFRSFRPGALGEGNHIKRPTTILSALVLGISTSIAVIQHWQKDRQKREELEKEKLGSELSFLKTQINPHFFFNTLNNIYALTTVDGELAGKAIHQLSRMMRYLLYGTENGQAMLSQEIAFVKDYISLMQLRVTDEVVLTIDLPPAPVDLPLAPMIFLPFVENAFKHGISATQPSYINIKLVQNGKLLALTVINSVVRDSAASLNAGSGIGLLNTRRRLDLLYPGKYKLTITEPGASNEYHIHLMLDLS